MLVIWGLNETVTSGPGMDCWGVPLATSITIGSSGKDMIRW